MAISLLFGFVEKRSCANADVGRVLRTGAWLGSKRVKMKILIVLRAWDGLNEVAPICKMILQETLICNLIPKPEAISKAATSWNHARWTAVEPCLAASVRRKPNDGREIRDARLTAGRARLMGF